MRKGCWLAIGLAMVMTLTLWNPVSAARPPEDIPDQDASDQSDGRQVGLRSTAIECLVVKPGMLDSASGTVRLEWQGQVEEAFLVLSVAGSQGGHSIYVNGQLVGKAPVRPGGQPCQVGPSAPIIISTDIIPIPTEVLAKGENVITLTNDANVNDGWTAANVHLEIHGVLSGPPVTSLEDTLPASPPLEMGGAMATVSGTVALTSTYELAQGYVITQVVWYQIPTDYNGSISVPLLIGVHGMGANGQAMRDLLAAEADNRNWLLAAPDMHGSYYINTGEKALAWVGAQHDIIDTIEYMVSEYEVDPSRIYITGGSMGGQTTAMMAAKYPDVFPAAAPWKPITDLTDWYSEIDDLGDPYGDLAVIENETGGTPSEVPFEYQRRSPMEVPQNSRLIPIRMWHDRQDILVPIHHSYDLRDAINSWNPLTPVVVIDPYIGGCPPYQHCYNPDPPELFDYLEGFTLSALPPLSVTIRTDESKPYYWLYIAQTGGDHWSEVEAAYSLADRTVTATISDTQPLTLALNLGSTPIMGPGGVDRPGMGLPATTYLVKGGSNNDLHDYTSGYLTTTLLTTGQFALTISAIEAEVSANPEIVSGWQTATSTITTVVQDHLGNPIPDNTIIQFSTTEGTFLNGSSTYSTTATGGQATTTLTLAAVAADLAEITVGVESITGSTSVNIIHPALEVAVTPNQTTIYSEQTVTYTYRITNTGDVALTGVILIDDNGTPADSSDDITACQDITLAAGATTSYSHSTTLTQITTNTATVTGQDPLDNDVTGSDSATVNVISPAIEVVITPHQTTIHSGQTVTYTYRITNTGDVALTGAILIDDNGTPVDSSDDITVCQDITLAAEATISYTRSVTLTQTTTNTATISGQDPLGNDVTGSDSATVSVISQVLGIKTYLPIVTRNKDSITRSVYQTRHYARALSWR